MFILDILVKNRKAILQQDQTDIVSGSVNIDAVRFSFSEEWESSINTAVFYVNESEVYEQLLDENNEAKIPHEVLKDEEWLKIGVYGVNGDTVIPSTVIELKINKGIIIGANAETEECQNVFVQVLAKLQEVEEKDVSLSKNLEAAKVELTETANNSIETINTKTVEYKEAISEIIDERDTLYGIADKTENKINSHAVLKGQMVNRNSGNLLANDYYDTYEKIPVEAEKDYTIQRENVMYFSILYAFYNELEEYISGSVLNKSNTNHGTITTPENAAYITISVATGNSSGEVYLWDSLMMSEGSVVKEYVPHKIISKEYNHEIYKQLETTDKEVKNISVQENRYPTICFGGEKLYSWYKKIIDGESVKVTLMGDSTMAETYLTDEHPEQKKAFYIQKMIEAVIGADKLTLVNWGVGSTSTGDLVGSHHSTEIIAELFPNGYMATRISTDTDLLIINYGINDYTSQSDILNYTERLEVFKNNYTEFFERLFGTEAVNGRPALGRTLDDIAVILMVPNIVTTDEERRQWAYDCREVLQELTDTFPFALFDTLKVNADHDFSDAWSIGDNIHPAYYVNAHTMQYLEKLVVPFAKSSGGNVNLSNYYSKKETETKIDEKIEEAIGDMLGGAS